MAVTDEAIEKIKEMIVSGELGPGGRLPKEADLAARLGLSRNSLREAVKALVLMNILDVRQGDGTYVTSLEPGLLVESMTFLVDFHSDASVLEFLEVRCILEPAAAAMAAVRVTDAELAQLRAVLDATPPHTSVEELVEHDLAFHRRVAAVSGNAVLSSLIEGIEGPTARARVWRGLTEKGAVERTLHEHEAIYAALAGRQPELARSWMTVHVSGVERWLRANR
jgi:GntR family transcriptional repressor for pyruvate dehydrogenase complex